MWTHTPRAQGPGPKPFGPKWFAPDSVNIWPALIGSTQVPPRAELLLGTMVGGALLRSDGYKLINAAQNPSAWYGPYSPNCTDGTAGMPPSANCADGCLFQVRFPACPVVISPPTSKLLPEVARDTCAKAKRRLHFMRCQATCIIKHNGGCHTARLAPPDHSLLCGAPISAPGSRRPRRARQSEGLQPLRVQRDGDTVQRACRRGLCPG